ncbi:hypothetical protein NQD34_009949 [Periophthalmus magnuspinnatus]|nr:hypothetical protein NQD34_009949 [Periophthalmus magnuspinnatus]
MLACICHFFTIVGICCPLPLLVLLSITIVVFCCPLLLSYLLSITIAVLLFITIVGIYCPLPLLVLITFLTIVGTLSNMMYHISCMSLTHSPQCNHVIQS